jgi:acyl-coenzyme A synthetase/AMP-(fatty) acid ligase
MFSVINLEVIYSEIPESLFPEMGPIDMDKDRAAILFSSGTTGFPKAIPYNHGMVWDRRPRSLEPKLL